MEKYTMFLKWKNQYCENYFTTQSNWQIQCNPCQITNGILHKIKTNKQTKTFINCIATQTPGVGEGQGDLVCCSPWGLKESDTTERLNWTELNWITLLYSRNWHNIVNQLYFNKINLNLKSHSSKHFSFTTIRKERSTDLIETIILRKSIADGYKQISYQSLEAHALSIFWKVIRGGILCKGTTMGKNLTTKD